MKTKIDYENALNNILDNYIEVCQSYADDNGMILTDIAVSCYLVEKHEIGKPTPEEIIGDFIIIDCYEPTTCRPVDSELREVNSELLRQYQKEMRKIISEYLEHCNSIQSSKVIFNSFSVDLEGSLEAEEYNPLTIKLKPEYIRV